MLGIEDEVAKLKKIRISESEYREIMRFDDDGGRPSDNYDIVPDPKPDSDSALSWKYEEKIKL